MQNTGPIGNWIRCSVQRATWSHAQSSIPTVLRFPPFPTRTSTDPVFGSKSDSVRASASLNPQPGTPQNRDQRTHPVRIPARAGLAHHKHDLLNRRRIRPTATVRAIAGVVPPSSATARRLKGSRRAVDRSSARSVTEHRRRDPNQLLAASMRPARDELLGLVDWTAEPDSATMRCALMAKSANVSGTGAAAGRPSRGVCGFRAWQGERSALLRWSRQPCRDGCRPAVRRQDIGLFAGWQPERWCRAW